MKKYFFLLMALSLAFFSCKLEKPAPEQTVIDNYRAMDEENISNYMKTVTGPRAAIADTLLEELFRDYDVSYTIDTIQLLSMVGDVAEVRTVVTARDEGGPKKFTDNRMVILHKLRYEHSKWLIFFSEPIETHFFGKQTIGDTTRADQDTDR